MIDKVNNSIYRANKGISRLTNEILAIEGMSSYKIRHFLNNIIDEKSRFLEIGTWKGSTLISALYKNNPEYSLSVDNWSEIFYNFYKKNWKDTCFASKDFFINCNEHLGYVPNFIESDCFELDKSNIKDINIYLYDGPHDDISQYKAIDYFYECLADEFILMIDDYNFTNVVINTQKALRDRKINKLFETNLIALYNGDNLEWWNGFYVAVCKK